MTDMHREAFESWARSQPQKYEFQRRPIDQSTYESSITRWSWETWQAAMRYRDEQEKQA